MLPAMHIQRLSRSVLASEVATSYMGLFKTKLQFTLKLSNIKNSSSLVV